VVTVPVVTTVVTVPVVTTVVTVPAVTTVTTVVTSLNLMTVGVEPEQQPENEIDEVAPAFSEEALALEFSRTHATTLRYVAKWGKWLIYDGTRWTFDEKLKTYSLARQLCRIAAKAVNKSKNLAKSIASAKTRNAVVTLACSDRRHAASIDQWDTDPWLLNSPGGVIDLRTGNLRQHRIANYMTKITAVTPDADCPTPLFTAFLKDVTNSDAELQAYIKRMLGYSLTGVTTEQALFFLYGTGGNGKTVLINTVRGIIGDYHKTAPLETFTAPTSDRHPTELAMLRGARLVTVAETEAGKRWAESRIKNLTGDDPVPARFMHQDFFEYVPQFKLIVYGNHKPALNAVNEAIRRRVNMLPFNVTISDDKRDRNLPQKLEAEWPGILTWMIDGCLQWQRLGLQPPEIVTEATDEYLEAEDTLTRWIDECLIRDPRASATSEDLFASWKGWAIDNGEWIGSQRKLSNDLGDKGFAPTRIGDKGARGFKGLGVRKRTSFDDPPVR
jgi:putative DNA primase/helicase